MKRKEQNTETRFVCDLNPDAKEVYLAGDFNEWDPADPVFAFQPTGSHLWQLTASFEEGLVAIKLTTEGNWDVNYGASPGAVAHFDSSFVIVDQGPDIPLICLHAHQLVIAERKSKKQSSTACLTFSTKKRNLLRKSYWTLRLWRWLHLSIW